MPERRQLIEFRFNPNRTPFHDRPEDPIWTAKWGRNPGCLEYKTPGRDWYDLLYVGVEPLKELHASIGAFLAKQAHEAHA